MKNTFRAYKYISFLGSRFPVEYDFVIFLEAIMQEKLSLKLSIFSNVLKPA